MGVVGLRIDELMRGRVGELGTEEAREWRTDWDMAAWEGPCVVEGGRLSWGL